MTFPVSPGVSITEVDYCPEPPYNMIHKALEIAFSYGQIDGAHHKTWAIDQMVRALTGDGYDAWIKEYENEVDGEKEYEWDTGIAP